jgi:Nif-specific regulatory protein
MPDFARPGSGCGNPGRSGNPGSPICRVKVLPYMFLRLGRITSDGEGLEKVVEVVLEILRERMGMVRSMVGLARGGRIVIHRSADLSPQEEARGVYSPGEGAIGRVLETCAPVVVPRIGDDPDFLDRTESHNRPGDEELSFACVPIARGRKVLGILAAERRYESPERRDLDVELLSTIACMIAPAVEVHLAEMQEKALSEENLRLQDSLRRKFHPSNIIGTSRPMQEVYEFISKVAPSKATVLILGESGVGKELVASTIHFGSPVATGPFVPFNCAALPENLVESELFGHEKGAFTGAAALRKGRFEEADGGTIFLDEIGELSLSMQAKLLRVLQERTFERVGGNEPVKVDIRVVAATNRDLEAMVREGSFRSDLYYRLWVVPVVIPPLRLRGSDIIALADHFVTAFSRENGKAVLRFSTTAMEMLMAYSWPGNVRELENVVERAVLLADDGVIHGCHLPPSLQNPSFLPANLALGNLDSRLAELEREMIVESLRRCRGNTSASSRELGITRRVLGIRMARLRIDPHGFKAHSPGERRA